MSILFARLTRLVAGLFAADRVPLDPDSMSLHDWADLPAHHPLSERTPC
ncbi:hypothetical protein [Devosia sp.]